MSTKKKKPGKADVDEELEGLEDWEYDVSIDKHRLDEEWLRHGPTARKYRKLLAYARTKLRRAQEKKKTVRSDLILQARRKGGEKLVKVDRMNDAAIEAWYRTQQDYIDAVDEEINAEYLVNMLESAVSDMTDRKHGLHDLVVLYQADYWTDPKEPRGSDFKEEARSKSKEKVREQLKKKYNKKEK